MALDSCKALVTFLFTEQYANPFYECLCLKILYLIYVADSLASNSRPKAFFFKNLVKLIYLVTSGLSCGSRDLVSCGMFPCGAWAFSSCVSRVQLRQGDSLVVHRLQSLQA